MCPVHMYVVPVYLCTCGEGQMTSIICPLNLAFEISEVEIEFSDLSEYLEYN